MNTAEYIGLGIIGAALLSLREDQAAIGKYYDTKYIRPNGRVDRYWHTLDIVPRQWGVEVRKERHFLDPDAAVKHFNLHSIEFGNWLNQQDRQGFMYATLVTLRDIGEITGIKQSRLGMGKKLALAFGARGHGGPAKAFYIPAPYHLINLTKKGGRHSFCHEYGHAIDYYFGGLSGGKSTRKQPDYSGKKPNTIPYLFEKVMDIILWNDDGSPSTYQNWLNNETEYYNRREEIWARVFESFCYMLFHGKGIFNTWGVETYMTRDLPDLKLVQKAAPYIFKITNRLK